MSAVNFTLYGVVGVLLVVILWCMWIGHQETAFQRELALLKATGPDTLIVKNTRLIEYGARDWVYYGVTRPDTLAWEYHGVTSGLYRYVISDTLIVPRHMDHFMFRFVEVGG